MHFPKFRIECHALALSIMIPLVDSRHPVIGFNGLPSMVFLARCIGMICETTDLLEAKAAEEAHSSCIRERHSHADFRIRFFDQQPPDAAGQDIAAISL